MSHAFGIVEHCLEYWVIPVMEKATCVLLEVCLESDCENTCLVLSTTKNLGIENENIERRDNHVDLVSATSRSAKSSKPGCPTNPDTPARCSPAFAVEPGSYKNLTCPETAGGCPQPRLSRAKPRHIACEADLEFGTRLWREHFPASLPRHAFDILTFLKLNLLSVILLARVNTL